MVFIDRDRIIGSFIEGGSVKNIINLGHYFCEEFFLLLVWLVYLQQLEPLVGVIHEGTLQKHLYLAFEDAFDLLPDHVEYFLREAVLVLV